MLNIVIFGPPGAGKGTQSKKLKEKYNLVHLSTGDLLRSEIAGGTDLGMQAKAIMDRGELVSDEIVIGMIDHKINEHKDGAGFIFDGFPRTVPQAEALDQLLSNHQLSISVVPMLEVEEEEITKRILERGKTSGRPDDQNEELIRTRFQKYESQTAPVADYYKKQEKVVSVHGIGEIEEIFTLLCTKIDC